ncbi:MAG: phosphoribosyl-ATP pyrophosphohydrolase [Ruminococcaceae bacterium]|nr:phosphoribosyl-ATP pyrophosphohydrolase [Oscillospiraceae bacterium]
MRVYDKLVRDKIPEIIADAGGKADFRVLTHEEYAVYLEAKLDEEVNEFHRDKTAEELADVLEVVYALAAEQGVSSEELMGIYQKKHQARGGFEKRLLLLTTQE